MAAQAPPHDTFALPKDGCDAIGGAGEPHEQGAVHGVAGDNARLLGVIPVRHEAPAKVRCLVLAGRHRTVGGQGDRPVPVLAEAADAGALGGALTGAGFASVDCTCSTAVDIFGCTPLRMISTRAVRVSLR